MNDGFRSIDNVSDSIGVYMWRSMAVPAVEEGTFERCRLADEQCGDTIRTKRLLQRLWSSWSLGSSGDRKRCYHRSMIDGQLIAHMTIAGEALSRASSPCARLLTPSQYYGTCNETRDVVDWAPRVMLIYKDNSYVSTLESR